MVNDDLAYERGSYCLTITDGSGAAQQFFGRFFTIHRRTSDGWRMVLDQDEAAEGHDDADVE